LPLEVLVAHTTLEAVADQPWLDAVGKPLADAVRALFKNAGPAGQTIRNALHGVWLGHPLHPVLTDVPIGAWTTALALDAKEASSGKEEYGHAADFALGLGLVAAVGAAVTGLNDWSETDGRSRRLGLLHGLMNLSATTLFATSYGLRRSGSRSAGRSWALAGYGLALGAAYVGGKLVYHDRIGVTHAVVAEPEEFTPVLESSALPENSMRKASIEDASFLVVRQNHRLCALAHSCAHLGGPLSEGTLKDGSVVCPWHGSEFALDDGHVINGPATEPQPCFQVREREGQIEVGPPSSV
jgi:nitrite reductase/ring-hydroxylating ferredoxin subunit/uncharacterized membrane protein